MVNQKKPVAVFDLVTWDVMKVSEEIGMLLFCHLMVERMMEELLAHAGRQRGEDWEAELSDTSFFRKVGACRHRTIEAGGQQQPIISGNLADALLMLNDLRNRTAHRYNEPLTYSEVHAYVARLEAAQVEFTDHFASSEAAARSLGYHEISALLHESTKHLVFELGFTLDKAGGPNLIA
jgi:hypothetical protein